MALSVRSAASIPELRRRLVGIGAVAVGVTVLATGSSVVKWAEQPGSVVGVWRLAIATGLWWAIVVYRHRKLAIPYPTRSTWLLAMPSGIAFGGDLALFFTGITKTSIAHAEFITTLSPLFLIPAGALFFSERPSWRAMSFGSLSLVGIAIVLGFGPEGGTATLNGDLFVAGALITWVAYLLATKRARRRLDVVSFMACVTPIAALTCAPAALALEGSALWSMSGHGWLAAAILAVATGVVGHGLLVVAQRHVAVATIGIVQIAQPAMAVVWGFIILGEEVRLAQVPGMILVMAGLALFTWSSQRTLRARQAATASDAVVPPHAETPVGD